MKILVTGCNGQVARSLAEKARNHNIVFVSRPKFELTDAESIIRAVHATHPDLVVSAAAYTDVDRAEAEPALAMESNGNAPGIIGAAAAEVGAPVIHLSTDYVFSGFGTRAWRESDPTEPLGQYGLSKLAGEQAIEASGATYAIIRTAWVYSPFGRNFVKTMLRLAAERDCLNVVNDQFGNPTSAFDIADAVLAVAERWAEDPEYGANAVYHFVGTGETNWANLARETFSLSAQRGGPSCVVNGIGSADYPTPAARPANSRLDCSKFAEIFGLRAPAWQVSLEKTIARLV